MADPRLYERDPARVAVLAKQRAELSHLIEQQEEKWLQLSAEYEEAVAQ